MIGPVASTIYVNQQTASVASENLSVQNKFELQHAAAVQASQEDKKEVEETRPAEENEEIDEEKEHEKKEADEEQKRREKKEDEEEEESEFHLDIRV
jgi:hypothetical protein